MSTLPTGLVALKHANHCCITCISSLACMGFLVVVRPYAYPNARTFCCARSAKHGFLARITGVKASTSQPDSALHGSAAVLIATSHLNTPCKWRCERKHVRTCSAEEVVCTADEDLVARVMQITGAPGVPCFASRQQCLRAHTSSMQPASKAGGMCPGMPVYQCCAIVPQRPSVGIAPYTAV